MELRWAIGHSGPALVAVVPRLQEDRKKFCILRSRTSRIFVLLQNCAARTVAVAVWSTANPIHIWIREFAIMSLECVAGDTSGVCAPHKPLCAACRSMAERRKRDEEIRASINKRLEESGERERCAGGVAVAPERGRTRVRARLKEILRTKLAESGWFDDLKSHCKGARGAARARARSLRARRALADGVTRPRRAEIIKTKGLKRITVEELVAEISPYGRCACAPWRLCFWELTGCVAASVPDSVKADMVARVRKFLQTS